MAWFGGRSGTVSGVNDMQEAEKGGGEARRRGCPPRFAAGESHPGGGRQANGSMSPIPGGTMMSWQCYLSPRYRRRPRQLLAGLVEGLRRRPGGSIAALRYSLLVEYPRSPHGPTHYVFTLPLFKTGLGP